MIPYEVIHLAYLVSAILFILGLRDLTHPDSARRGAILGAIGMLVAVIGTLVHREILQFEWIALGLVVGTVIGIPMGLWIPMTKMPERIALSHSFGGLAVALVGVVHYTHAATHLTHFELTATCFEVMLGAITFTGSLMAFGKLQGLLPGKPMTFKLQNVITVSVLLSLVGMIVYVVATPGANTIFYILFGLAFLFGILLVLPIGGADMPVVICLLNSYAGLAACGAGFALSNTILIVCGALDGGSGFILALVMSKAMNRSFANVLFGAFGSEPAKGELKKATGAVNEASIEEAGEILKNATSVIVVPGYGMAVAQAQHAVRDLASLLDKRGTPVKYAIHPVAGRMPGHMNVLLAEANVPYDQLYDLDQINDEFSRTDVALVVGANDVVNPAAKKNPGSPIYGMPILNADQARAVIVLKRSMNPGFAGIENELFVQSNTMMVFGDAKQTLMQLSTTLKD